MLDGMIVELTHATVNGPVVQTGVRRSLDGPPLPTAIEPKGSERRMKMKRKALAISVLMTLGAITAFGSNANLNVNGNNTNNYVASGNNRLNVNFKNTRNNRNNRNNKNNRVANSVNN
jgi:hypothetical protein